MHSYVNYDIIDYIQNFQFSLNKGAYFHDTLHLCDYRTIWCG